MPAERYFLETTFKVHEQHELKDAEFHHLSHVMRTRKGEMVELVNGKGALAHAMVQEIKKEKVLLQIEQVKQEDPHSYHLILAQALPKPNRLDFILEKGTELGVDSFWLFPGQRSAKKEFFPHQWERARTLTIAAMKQSGRLTLPEILLQPPLEEWPSLTNMTAFFGDLALEALPFEKEWHKLKNPSQKILFVTGPEAGWSEQEIENLRKQGATGVKLHPHILRTDTASIMALGLLSHWLFINTYQGDLKK